MTYDDEPTIKNAIWKRLHQPGTTEIADIRVINHPDAKPAYIEVGIWFVLKDRIQIDGLVDPRSFFDLPVEFTHSHLLNEIDEIAEQLKAVRKETAIARIMFNPEARQGRSAVLGTGLRGRWLDTGAVRAGSQQPN